MTADNPLYAEIDRLRAEKARLREILDGCAFALEYFAHRMGGTDEMLALPRKAREVLEATK